MKLETKVTKQKVLREVEETLNEYILTLTYDEACALKAVLGKIAGNSEGPSPRVHTSKIYKALENAGLHYLDPDVTRFGDQVTESMRIGPKTNVW